MTQSGWNAESHHLSAVGHHDLDGYGDGMQVLREGNALYVGHFGPSGMGTSILDASDPTDLRLVRQLPSPGGSHTHKVQVAEGLLLVNHEQFRGGDPFSAGLAVYDLADPLDPQRIGWFDSTGRGVHRIVWTGGRYAYVSATPEGYNDRIFVIVDLADPTNPVEAGRWWWPGQWLAGGEEPTWPEGKRYAAHHGLLSDDGALAYVGYGDAGLVVLDVRDPAAPTQVGALGWEPGGDTHTCLPLPGRDLLVVTDEVVDNSTEEHLVRIVDVSDPAAPALVSHCPVPLGDYPTRGLRFGPHNTHENRPGSYRSAEVVFVTYFNGGLRVYDVSDAEQPTEIAYWVPTTPPGQQAVQVNDLFVAADLDIYVTDRVTGGVYVVRPDEELADRMRAASLD